MNTIPPRGKVGFIFYVFLSISLLFLFAGLYSSYMLATIVHQKDLTLKVNPVGVIFNYTLQNGGYFLTLNLTLINPGPYDLYVRQISWTTFLINGSSRYQANNFFAYYPRGIHIGSGSYKYIFVIDNSSVKQWEGYVYPKIVWEKTHLGNTTWYILLDIKATLDNYDTENFKYNVRTWYLWHLPEVDVEYESLFNAP
jgi:hypothetical protein